MLHITDSQNEFIGEMEGWGESVILPVALSAGTRYNINMELYTTYGPGNYTISVSPATAFPSSGTVRVTTPTVYSFVPARTGMWTFSLSNTGATQPYMEAYDSNGRFIANSYGLYGFESSMSVFLFAGQSYAINAEYGTYATGSYTISTSSATPMVYPASGGTQNVNGTTAYSFTPTRSGVWLITTSNNGMSDPFIEVYHSSGMLLDFDDDSSGNLNAFVALPLEAGETYFINARFAYGSSGTYTLSVSPAPSMPTSGQVRANGMTAFTLTANRTGLWNLQMSNYGNSDPSLEIYDLIGNFVGVVTSEWDYPLFLVAGETYIVRTWYERTVGSVTITVSFTPPLTLPGGGGDVRVNGGALYTFTPSQSAVWEIKTSNNGSSDPYLVVIDSDGNVIDFGDDVGDDLNALLYIDLTARETYYIFVGFYDEGQNSCTLSVSLAGPTDLSGNGDNLRIPVAAKHHTAFERFDLQLFAKS